MKVDIAIKETKDHAGELEGIDDINSPEDEEWARIINEKFVHNEKAVTLRLKGGEGSGNFGHGGRPGEVGGSASERGGGGEDSRWDHAQKINMVTYGKAQGIEHGDLLSTTMMNAPYRTEEEFAKDFVDDNPVPRASKSAKPYQVEHVLYGISKVLEEYGGSRATAIDGKDLERTTGLNERDLDFMTSRYMSDWLGTERTHGLYQFRIRASARNPYQFDKKNGIVSNAEALTKAMRDFGFRHPRNLYIYLTKLGTEKKEIIIRLKEDK